MPPEQPSREPQDSAGDYRWPDNASRATLQEAAPRLQQEKNGATHYAIGLLEDELRHGRDALETLAEQ
jgi:hypothetical protein